MESIRPYKCVIIGGSWGGIEAVNAIISKLPANFPIPIIVVLHQHRRAVGRIHEIFQRQTALKVKEADEKEKPIAGSVYIAPANYHLLVEKDQTFSFSIDEHVHFSRPSIDVAFESSAEVFRNDLIGVLLTGANHDGAAGLGRIKYFGGLAIAQNPDTAQAPAMPQSAIDQVKVDQILELPEISDYLVSITLGPTLIREVVD